MAGKENGEIQRREFLKLAGGTSLGLTVSHEIRNPVLENQRCPAASRFRHFLLSHESKAFRQSLASVHIAVNLASAAGADVDPLAHSEAARIIADTVSQWEEAGEADWVGPTAWVNPERPGGLDVVAYRTRAAELMALGALLMSAGGGHPEQLASNIARAAFGVDPNSVIVGDVVGARLLDVDPSKLPSRLDGFRRFLDRTCVGGIVHAAGQFGQVAANRPRPMAGAQISEVSPGQGCAGDEVVIRGTGFGVTRPGNVTVMFTTRDGGCAAAEVKGWSDTEITVVVPHNVGHGCVGLAEQPSGFGRIAEAAGQFAGELETCLGPMVGPAADRIRRSAIAVQAAACPTCNDSRTRFAGGPPVVKTFSANGRSVAEILPGSSVTVAWEVESADEVHIVSLGSVLPPVPKPHDPRAGNVTFENIQLDDGTVGSWQLAASNRCGTTIATIDVVIRGRKALVLSGGGAKGAFQVGAVRCLRDVAGINFDIISGASVGALNAAKLAEGGGALADLEALWLGMQDSTDLYLEREWFQRLEPIIQLVFRAGASSLGFEAGRLAISYAANMILGRLLSAMGIPGIVFSVFTSFAPVINGVIDLVSFFNAVKQALADPSLFLFTPIEQKINTFIDPDKIARSRIQLRITAVALESGKARVFDNGGVMLGTGFPVPLREAIRASASIPIAFTPVPLHGLNGTEQYIDGGVRENVPAAAAVQAGAHRLYTILLNPREVGFTHGFSQPTMLKIAGRTVDLVLDEAQRNDFAPFRGFGIPTTEIAPTFLVHDTLLVDPGLISINMDYGYMRAYDDVVANATTQTAMRALSDEITANRVEIWAAEHYSNGQRLPWLVRGQLIPVADPVALQSVRDHKLLLRAKVFERIAASDGRSVPFNRSSWWQQWERHPWRPLIPSPWDAFGSRLGKLPQVPVPPA